MVGSSYDPQWAFPDVSPHYHHHDNGGSHDDSPPKMRNKWCSSFTLHSTFSDRFSPAALVARAHSKEMVVWVIHEYDTKIAGSVAPARIHVAQALVESSDLDNLKQAISRQLCDGGPAHAMDATSCGTTF
ncbi:hypothetical protein OPV22_011509 [Ensete ventricosum]|uniref:Uncharacterized protein n=1 Tax=Ensete ventricosum TaxID=4639 RepID=A0AAV8RNG6_ENSVE|nr:hypothetical protein OPV22_011509 [Ensete ventricosum]